MPRRKKESDDLHARFVSAGGALASLNLKWRRLDPTKEVLVKSFSVKYDGWDFFIILRGTLGVADVVQFFRCDNLEKLPALLLQKIAQGDWKPDKFGSDANIRTK